MINEGLRIMALYDDYFTNEDKPFAENLNDALLLSNVFDMTVNVEAPLMFSNKTWVNTISPRKCSVSILTLKKGLPSGVSVRTDSETGNSTLSGTGTVELSWYPNFNSFGKFKAITWEAEGDITINLKTRNGTPIASNINKGTIENQSSELRTLQEIIIELVFNNATLKSLTVTMENKQQERYGATVGITDVTGLDDAITAINSKDTQQDVQIADLINANNEIFNYDLLVSDYNPTINDDIVVSCKVTDFYGVEVAGESFTLKRNGTTVGTSTTNLQGVATWNVTCDEWGLQDFRVGNTSIQVNVTGWKQIAKYSTNRITLYSDGKWGMVVINGSWPKSTTGEIVLGIIDSEYSPFSNVSTNYSYGANSYQAVYTRETNICINRSRTGEYGVYCTLYFRLATAKY